MTNKEAIKELEEVRDNLIDDFTFANERYIDALDLAIKALVERPTVDTTCPNCDSGYAQGYSDGYLKGKEERPTGEWINRNGNTIYPFWERYECSICHGYSDMADYCCHCGAKMKGEE